MGFLEYILFGNHILAMTNPNNTATKLYKICVMFYNKNQIIIFLFYLY